MVRRNTFGRLSLSIGFAIPSTLLRVTPVTPRQKLPLEKRTNIEHIAQTTLSL
jgi:hypothetical protein